MQPPAMDSLKPQRKVSIPLSLAILSTALLLFLTPAIRPLHAVRALLLPPCGHIVLVSAARHGSSWFLNSAEHCPSTTSFESLNHASELWNHALQGPVRELTPLQAADYLDNNHSIKIFPLVFFRNSTRLGVLLDEVKLRMIPVFVLTRDLQHSYQSYRAAVRNREWNVNDASFGRRTRVRGVELDHEGRKYVERVLAFFKGVREMLRERGVVWDEFDFDDVVERRVIVGERNQCVIRNCNFAGAFKER